MRSGGPGGLGYQAQYPYGVEYTQTANDREKYATYTRDSVTGLDYAMNRYYSSVWGRFLSPDPSGRSIHLGDPESWNRYAYVRNNPINRRDRWGLDDDCPPDSVCISGSDDDPEPRPYSDEGFFFELDFGWEWSWNGPGVAEGVRGGAGTGGGSWASALNNIRLGTAIVAADLAPGAIPGDCQGDIDALNAKASATAGAQPVTDATVAGAVVGIDAENGLAATAPLSSLNDPSIPAQFLTFQ